MLTLSHTLYIQYIQKRKEVKPLNIIISNSSNLPIYQQIMNQIKDAILRGEVNSGEAVPSIRELAKEL